LPSLPSQTAIPGALVQLLSVATAAFPAGTTVYYGEDLPAYSAPLTFQITEITGDQVPAEIGQYRREETFEFICSLIAYQGGVPDFVAQLISVTSSFALLSLAIGNNPRLNDSVRFAEVGNFRITSATDPNGQGATTLDFAVRCSQRVTSLT
jgi:hypothetical protein